MKQNNSDNIIQSVSLSVWCLCLVYILIPDLSTCKDVYRTPSTDFSKHSLVKPKLLHGRTKREITSTKDMTGSHHREVTLTVNIEVEEHELELRLNEALVPHGHALSYQQDGRTMLHVPEKEELDLCQYSGRVRGRPGSWAAVSTCHGVQGVIYDGRQLWYIEPAHGDITSDHFLYSHKHLTKKHHCGHEDGTKHISSYDPIIPSQVLAQNRSTASRYKRYTIEDTLVREPYNADRRSRYVELVLVVDHGEYLASGSELQLVQRQMKDLANILNSVYAPLNIFIALVGVEVWTEYDMITLDSGSSTTLDNFNKYRSTDLVKRIPNDNAHLVTRQRFNQDIVGKAYIGTICSNTKSGGVETNHSRVIGVMAMTIAHEMGHNFGMNHDQDGCACLGRCIMSSHTVGSLIPVHWSSCSLKALSLSFEKGLDYCLRNEPKRLFESPTCGNGFLEEGEQCDCGTAPGAFSPEDSDRNACTACCKPDCTLRANATCGHGQCCDLTTCSPKATGTECRSADRECDLPEFCNGTSPFCPSDVHKMDATPCGKGQAYCVRGSCRSHTDQCRLLWGVTGNRSDDICYQEANVNGDQYGNCGYDPVSQTFRRCLPQDVLCGLLQCGHLGNQLEISNFDTARVGSFYVYGKKKITPCHSAIIDMGLSDVDPGLVPDGAKCGPDKMCMQQRCVSVERVRELVRRATGSVCPSDCSGHGVCNSNGNCHCEAGYAPPLCALPGAGGSVDSGPISDTSNLRRFMLAMYIIFLGIVPTIILILLLIYCCPYCTPLRSKIHRSHVDSYRRSTKSSFKVAIPNLNSFGKWFHDTNKISRDNNCHLTVKAELIKDKSVRERVTIKHEFEDKDHLDICYVGKSNKKIVHSANIPAQSINTKNVIVQNYNIAQIHNKTAANNDVSKPKVDDIKKKYESLEEQKYSNSPNFKDLNKELSILKNSKIDSPINSLKPSSSMTKPYLSPIPSVSLKPSVSPKPGVSPKPNRLPSENNPKPEIRNAGLTSTTNELVNQRSKLRKVGNIRDVSK